MPPGCGRSQQGVPHTWPLTVVEELTGTMHEGLQETVPHVAPGEPVMTKTAGDEVSRTPCGEQAVSVAAPSRLSWTVCSWPLLFLINSALCLCSSAL